MPILKRNGVGLYYEVHGSGPPILLTHGFGSTSRMWAGQIEPLSQSHRLILWDMRGHGRTDSPADLALYSEAETVADIAAILDEVGAPRAVIGGLSLGGYMSLAFWLAHPERVSALMLCDTGPGFKKDEARAAWNHTALERADQIETMGLERLRTLTKEMRPEDHRAAAGVVNAARGMLTQKDARIISALPSIDKPTLVVVGSEDKPFLVGCAYMAAKIPGAEHVLIDNAGHSANIDQPAVFNAAVLDFLRRAGA